MNYRSIADMNDAIARNLHHIPRDIDLVVAVPRSGLLAGTMIALDLNLPLADLDGFLAGRILAAGRTRRQAGFDNDASQFKHVLVVDDSIRTGKAMAEARSRVTAAHPETQFTFCAIYGTRDSSGCGSLVFEVVPHPRMFQWNVMHHPLLKYCCVDIDGVLC